MKHLTIILVCIALLCFAGTSFAVTKMPKHHKADTTSAPAPVATDDENFDGIAASPVDTTFAETAQAAEPEAAPMERTLSKTDEAVVEKLTEPQSQTFDAVSAPEPTAVPVQKISVQDRPMTITAKPTPEGNRDFGCTVNGDFFVSKDFIKRKANLRAATAIYLICDYNDWGKQEQIAFKDAGKYWYVKIDVSYEPGKKVMWNITNEDQNRWGVQYGQEWDNTIPNGDGSGRNFANMPGTFLPFTP